MNPEALTATARPEIAGLPATIEPLGIALESFDYPHPVRFMAIATHNQDVRMAFMDVHPTGKANGRTVLLLHGKDFFGEYWRRTINALARGGYRVVVPDQIGFGKSSKPDVYYSFRFLATNTRKLLDLLGIDKVAVVGHSMGGMLATRFALMHPDRATHLVLENPLGLEDYSEKVPYVSSAELYRNLLTLKEEQIREHHQQYFARWLPAYDRYVRVHYRWTLSGEYPRLAWASALTYQMIYEQPVLHDFPQVRSPTLFVVGQADRTTLGRERVPAEVGELLGRYPELGRKAAARVRQAKLVELDGVGHVPHLEAAKRFNAELLSFLESPPPTPKPPATPQN